MNWDGLDRRRFVRGVIPFKVFIHLPGDKVINGYADDFSQVGMRISLQDQLEVGSIINLEIYLYEDADPISCQGKVIWVKQKSSSLDKDVYLFETGIDFSKTNP